MNSQGECSSKKKKKHVLQLNKFLRIFQGVISPSKIGRPASQSPYPSLIQNYFFLLLLLAK